MRHPSWDALVPDDAQPWTPLDTVRLSPPPRELVRDRVRTHGGDEIEYTYRPRGPRAVFVLPVTAAGEAVLLRQYRYPPRAFLTEIVAGGIEEGEDVEAAAARELREEVGGTAAEFVALPGVYPQPSISGVVFHGVLALGVTLGERAPEASELIEPLAVPLPEAYRRLEAGAIPDAMSALTLFHARAELVRRGLL